MPDERRINRDDLFEWFDQQPIDAPPPAFEPAPEPVAERRAPAAQRSAVRNGNTLETQLHNFHLTIAREWSVFQQFPRSVNGKIIGFGPPDFIAVSRTMTVLFDAKSTVKQKWSLNLIEPHQVNALVRFHGTAGIYLRTADGDAWIPIGVLFPKWERFYRTTKPEYLTIADGVPIRDMDWTAACR